MNTAMTTQLTSKLAERLGMEGGEELVNVLKATAFKGQVSDAQMTALLIVANQYGLNPWTKEIYAFPDKNNGIVPVMGVDGWTRIMNAHPAFDGIEFDEGGEGNAAWAECIIYRKDRAHPTKVREYLSECKRNTGPWGSHPRRMLRHKAMIQCARVAFSYGGIYDDDEAAQIIERDVTPITGTTAQGATARLREVAVINHGDNNAGDPRRDEQQGDSGGHAGAAAGADGRNRPADDAGNGDGPAEDVGGQEEGEPASGNPPRSMESAPPATSMAQVIASLKACKTVEALDDAASSIDHKSFTAIETKAISAAYLERKAAIEDGPKGGKRGGME